MPRIIQALKSETKLSSPESETEKNNDPEPGRRLEKGHLSIALS